MFCLIVVPEAAAKPQALDFLDDIFGAAPAPAPAAAPAFAQPQAFPGVAAQQPAIPQQPVVQQQPPPPAAAPASVIDDLLSGPLPASSVTPPSAPAVQSATVNVFRKDGSVTPVSLWSREGVRFPCPPLCPTALSSGRQSFQFVGRATATATALATASAPATAAGRSLTGLIYPCLFSFRTASPLCSGHRRGRARPPPPENYSLSGKGYGRAGGGGLCWSPFLDGNLPFWKCATEGRESRRKGGSCILLHAAKRCVCTDMRNLWDRHFCWRPLPAPPQPLPPPRPRLRKVRPEQHQHQQQRSRTDSTRQSCADSAIHRYRIATATATMIATAAAAMQHQ